MKINREDVVQSSLVVERWCTNSESCVGCPFFDRQNCAVTGETPETWHLEEYLRKRGLKDG